MYFQDLVLALQDYWRKKGCVLTSAYDLEKGAGTFNPATFLRALGPEPFNAAYIEPCRRPTDGRYGENPIRMQHYYQFQVVLKPNPENMMELYLDSLAAIGINTLEHDIRFVHDDWESPTLGAWGLGWEVWIDGMEVTQYTYFQQVGGIELSPVMGEITYGLERLCMFLQNLDNVYNLAYNSYLNYGDLFHQNELQFSKHNFELADVSLHCELFNRYEKECTTLCAAGTPIPALDYCLKASHSFNLLDARGAISVSERQGYILRVRKLARAIAEAWLSCRKELNFPLTKIEPTNKSDPATFAVAAKDKNPIEPFIQGLESNIVPSNLPLLIELGVEEIPAKVFDSLLKILPELTDAQFRNLDLGFEDICIFTTPRRICLSVGSVRTRQQDQNLSIKGPPLRIAKDSLGQWTKAACGFANKNGVDLDNLETRRIGDVDYIFARVKHNGRTALEVLMESIPKFFSSIPWYKTMCWGTQKVRFVRPVRWLAAMLGDWIIPTEFAGVSSDKYSFGHRFLAPDSITVNADRDRYLKSLRNAFVIADHHERKNLIRQQINEMAAENGLVWKEDDELLAEVTNLVEYPVEIFCSFEQKYLELPEIVLISEMKKHQKYFALHTSDGKLCNNFIAISNMQCKDTDALRSGYEKVLRSRFADAEFFLAEDMKISLNERVPLLSRAIFQNRLGSILEKVERIKHLAAYIGSELSLPNENLLTVEKIAHLCKSDLNSNMVAEFPDLQGEIGFHYALRQEFPEIIASGIREHYLPRNIVDEYPSTPEAAIVGIADRIDTLVGVFGIGKEPTGTADPFGLRRACLTCIAIVIHLKFRLNLQKAISKSVQTYSDIFGESRKKLLEQQILDFFQVRIIGFLQDGKHAGLLANTIDYTTTSLSKPGDAENGFPLDFIKSVVFASPTWYDVTDLLNRLRAMNQFRLRDDFVDISATFKRVNNILRNESINGHVDPLHLKMVEENVLWEAFLLADRSATELIEKENYTSALTTLAQLRDPVDKFFDAVLVNDPDNEIRINRQCLLQNILSLLLRIADFSQIQGE